MNPEFIECHYLELPKRRTKIDEVAERRLGEELLKMGVRWKKVNLWDDFYIYQQIYKGQPFQLLIFPDVLSLREDNLRIVRKIKI